MPTILRAPVYLSCFGNLFYPLEVRELVRASDDFRPSHFIKLTLAEFALVRFALDCGAEPSTVWHEIRIHRQHQSN